MTTTKQTGRTNPRYLCPACGSPDVAYVEKWSSYVAFDQAEADNNERVYEPHATLYQSEEEFELAYPECQKCYWNRDGKFAWEDFTPVEKDTKLAAEKGAKP